jgi:hypothetical protein
VLAPSGGAAPVASPEHVAAPAASPATSVPVVSSRARRLARVSTFAAALGALAIWLAMRPAAAPPPPATDTTRVVAALPANPAPETSPSRQLVPGDAGHAVDLAYTAGWPHVIDDVIDGAQHTRPPPPIAEARSPAAASPRPPVAPPMHAPAAPPTRARAAIGAGSARQVSPEAVPTDPAPPAPIAPGAADASLEVISSRFRNDDYAAIVRTCRASLLNRDIAGFCVMAACRELDSAQVARWLPFDDPGRRGDRAAFCKEHGGVDIGTTLDCGANPLDCR